ncbi:DUF998 domain-containing protein [Cryptosporangium minutisporangium]|uniref:DUF998 domain-containing protein n=1 Tax=Cryptosporangium minutisporangium TaxID=113569 RepID=UPI0031EC352E
MRNRYRAVLTLSGLGVGCVVASLALYALLHLVPPSAALGWTRRTISSYALLSNGWVFDVATLLLAAGSLAVLAALRRAGVARQGAVVALLLWVAGLVGVVWFEKHNWAVGPSFSGDVHRAASLLAFLSLPAGALLAAAPHQRGPGAQRPARLVALGGVASLLCFSPILWALLSEPWTGVRWWRAIPLGGVERLLGLAEVTTVLLLARWAVSAARSARTPDRATAVTARR